MLPSTIELREADQPVVHRLPRAVAVGVASANIATVAPMLGPDEYRVSGIPPAGAVVATGFLADRWSVFEDLVTVDLREAFKPYGGVLVSQYQSTLDVEGTVKIAPDLVWLVDGQVRACIDVKYKVERHGKHPNADLYQTAGVLPALRAASRPSCRCRR